MSPDSRRTDRRESYRRQEDRQDAHDARIRNGVRYFIVIAAVVLGLYGSYQATRTADEAKAQSARLAVVTRDVAVTQQSLAVAQRGIAEVHMRILNTQHALLVSQKASAETRVKTVSQRCLLTAQILKVLRAHDLGDVKPFQISYAECEAQLKTVDQIAAATPNP